MEFLRKRVRRSSLRRIRPRHPVVAVAIWAAGCGVLAGPQPQLAGEILQISSELTRSGTQTTVIARFTNASDRDLFLRLCGGVIHVGAEHLAEGQWQFYSRFACITGAGGDNPGQVRVSQGVEVSRVFDHTAEGTFRLIVRYGETPDRPVEYQAVTVPFELDRN